ncbi:MAG TPA: RtcB family protein [Candidatus Nanoarchaeia archaeon]|nr:RtcB family protein [Candidatus Nanoarchaeia archaeon]
MEIKKISDNIYEIPKSGNMNVPARIYASQSLFEAMKKDKTLEQVKNVACLPGILKESIALPDAHQGYGFSIGGVAAFDMDSGVISPGGVGYDINCGVRLLKTNLTRKDIIKKQEQIAQGLQRKIPSGVGRGSRFNIPKKELKEIMEGGAKRMVEKGYGEKNDCLSIEEEGCMSGADSSKVSERAMKRGIGQLGTLGAGNHFLEVQYVDELFDGKIAKIFDLKKEQVMIMIHCGSRGLGHQIASDYIKKMEDEYGIKNLQDSKKNSQYHPNWIDIDRELINAPIKSRLGKDYISAMAAAMNFAFANRQLITHWIREEIRHFFPNAEIEIVYDVCHNIAKFEEHKIDGKRKIVCVHRKGATRSFGAGRKEIPKKYRKIGQPVIIPGSMGTSSYLLIGTKKAEEMTFGSSVHGGGRIKSRSLALKTLNPKKIREELSKKGITIMSQSQKSLVEEAPEAYKDIDEVVKIVDELGINKKVAKLKPLIVIKG